MYYLHYVENCSPKLKKFISQKSLDAFIKKFPSDKLSGNWLDFVIKGELKLVDVDYAERLKLKGYKGKIIA